jgi:hypothetical protein
MTKRRQTFEIFAPTKGLTSNTPDNIMDPRAQPFGQNGKMYYGFNQKEYGTSLYATGVASVLGTSPNLLYEARFPNANSLQVFTHTGVNRYTSGTDSFVSDGQTFTGTYTDYWSAVVHADRFYYTNGVDPIQVKPSFSATGTVMHSAVATSTYKAWGLLSLFDHLVLYHTIENGTEHAKGVRWTDKGALSPSATTDFVNGTAGAIDLPDVVGNIQAAAQLGAGAAIYGNKTIHNQYFVGGDEVFRFEKVVDGLGTPSRRGVAAYKDANYFISENNFHAYNGGDDVRDIGDPIKRFAFGLINHSAISNAFVEVDPAEEEVLFHVPTGTSSLPNRTFVYRINDDSWSMLIRNYTANGVFTRKTGLTIGELVGPIGAQNFKYGDAFISVESLTRLYGDQSGRVVKVDPALYSVSESGVALPQTFIYETPDITNAKAKDTVSGEVVDFTSNDKRFVQMNIDAKGNGSLNVLYSTDRGSSFTALPESPLTLVATGTSYVMDIDINSKQARFRFTNTSTNEFCAVEYVGVNFIPGSDNG